MVIEGQLVGYTDEGKGKVVVLLHGWGQSTTTFDTLAESLLKKYRVIRFDFPGFGSSPRPKDDWKIKDYSHLTAQLLKKLKIKALYAVIGHSFGGRVIIKGFSTKELIAEKVVLIGAAGPKSSQQLKKVIFKAIAKTGKAATALPGLRALRPKLRGKLYQAAGSTDYLNAASMQKIFLNTINEDLLPEVSAIDKPTLMIWGERDDEVPVSVAKRMKDQLSNAKLLVVPGAGHFVHNDEPALVESEIEAFL